MLIDNLWKKASKAIDQKETEKSNIKLLESKLIKEKPDEEEVVKKLVNKIVPSQFDFIKTKKSTYDMGNLNLKVVYESKLKNNEKISFLSYLVKFREQLEATFGLSSKGIKVTGLKILLDKSSIGNADRYTVYKYCPVLENISFTSEENVPIEKVNGGTIRTVEYGNMFIQYVSGALNANGKAGMFCFFNQRTYNDTKQGNDFYVNWLNPYDDKVDRLMHKNGTSEISSTKLNDIYANQYITINLTHSDNDVSVLFFTGKTMDEVKVDVKIKVIFNIEISKEDFIQNYNSQNKINDVVLKNLLIVNSSLKILELYKFAIAVDKPNLIKVFDSALKEYDNNKFIIKLYNKFKPIYKTLISMATYGVSKSGIYKLIYFIKKGNIKLPKKEFNVIPSGIYAQITTGIEFDSLLKIATNLSSYTLSDFVNQFLMVATYSFDIGNERTISYAVLSNINNLAENFEFIEKYGRLNIMDKAAIIKTSVEQINPDDKELYYNVEKGKYENENLQDDIKKQQDANLKEAEEYEKLINEKIEGYKKQLEDKEKQLKEIKEKNQKDEEEITKIYNENKADIETAIQLRNILEPQITNLREYKESLEIQAARGEQVDTSIYAQTLHKLQELEQEYANKVSKVNDFQIKTQEMLDKKKLIAEDEKILQQDKEMLKKGIEIERENINRKKKNVKKVAAEKIIKNK